MNVGKVVIAVDSFKGSLSSLEAGEAVREGVLDALPGAEVVVLPVADGGEGTVDALMSALHGQTVSASVTGPYGEIIDAVYGIVPERNLAVMEISAAAGITLSQRREPRYATTFGVGQMIIDAIRRGCREFVIGLGGSATNDGGLGMLTALGFQFLNENGKPCGITAEALGEVRYVDQRHVASELFACRFLVACDVKNPLCGMNGCTYIFGLQKGVHEDERQQMDSDMESFADTLASSLGVDFKNTPGAGAAGGLGFAFLSCLNSTLRSGVDLVLDKLSLDEHLWNADLVITGEGRLDGQTAFGKVPIGVASRAKRYGIPVVAVAGSVLPGAEACLDLGIDAYFPVLSGPMSLEQAMVPTVARGNLTRITSQILRLCMLKSTF